MEKNSILECKGEIVEKIEHNYDEDDGSILIYWCESWVKLTKYGGRNH